MKVPLDRTKVVVRHLPPTFSESDLVDDVDSRFLGRYNWLSFRPGKSSHKHLNHSRAYINFNRSEDVIEFAEFFNGHVFVNEKGTQFKASVEYAPSQWVPNHCSKKDGREGTILKDPEYFEFLEFLAKPTENLPSAEIQLERKEAERAGTAKDVPIVTPLMDYVRKKRASKGGTRQRSVLNGKSTRRVYGNLSKSPVLGSSKRGSGKRRTPATMYVLRDSSKVSSKDKHTYLLVSRQDDQQFKEKSTSLAVSGTDALEGESGGSGSASAGIGKKILLLKGKEKEIPNVSSSSLQQGASSPSKSSDSPAPVRQNPQQEAGGRIIRSILLNRDARRNQAPPESQSELRLLTSNQDREKRSSRPPSTYQKDINGIPDDRSVNNDVLTVHSGKQERWIKNKDRPDRGVWTPLRCSDGSHSSNDSLPSSTYRTSQSTDSVEDVKMLVNRGGDYHNTRGSRGSHYSVDNGAYRHGCRRGSVYNPKDFDGSSAVEAKSSKRAGYGSHEKQVWVQKSSSGS